MSYLEKFQIELDNKSGVYFPGDRVTGRLYMNVKESTKINSVSIKANGEAYVHWSEGTGVGVGVGVGVGTGDDSRSYSARVPYLENKKVVLEQEDKQELVLDIGEQEFSFSFHLPDNIPTSFESSNGRIRYWIEGVIDKKMSLDRYTHATFTVINKHDLNLIPSLRLPTSVNERKVFCCLFCKSDPVEITFDIQKTGFVCGETAIMNVMINNQSNRVIKPVEINLKQYINVITSSKSKRTIENVATNPIETYQIKPHSLESFRNLQIKIPATCSSLGDTCEIIKNEYKFELKVKGNGLTIAAYLSIPVEIGTVPLIGDTTNLSQNCTYEKVKSRGENNDGQIHRNSFINFYDPLYPLFMESSKNTEKK